MGPRHYEQARNLQYDLSRFAKNHLSDIVDAVHFRVVKLEYANDVVRLYKVASVWPKDVHDAPVSTYPGCDASYCQQNDDPWYHSQSIKDQWDRKHAESDLCFHHENRRSHPANLCSM